MNARQFYVLTVWGGVEPEAHGPYKTAEERDRTAREMRACGANCDAVCWLDMDADWQKIIVTTGAYPAAFFEEIAA